MTRAVTRKIAKRRYRSDAGSSLLELLIAGLVLTVGLLGGTMLIIAAIANNNRSRMDSTATLVAQMTLERIASIPANATTSSTPDSSTTIVDCNPNSSLASHIVNTLGSSSGAGAPLNTAGGISFGSSTVTGYSMTYYSCQSSMGDPQGSYDVRWHVKTLSANAKLVIVAAERTGTQGGHANFFAQPVSLKMIVGL